MKIPEAKQLVTDLLAKAGFVFDTLEIEDRGEGEFYINIASKADAVRLVGRNGEVLLGLQHLVKSAFRSQGITEENEHVKIDVDSYRTKQEENVLAMADNRAKMVMDTGRTEVLPSMSSFFRRLVHLHIKEKYPQLTSYSQGEGNFRSVFVALASGSPAEDLASAPDLYVDEQF